MKSFYYSFYSNGCVNFYYLIINCFNLRINV